MNHSTYFITTSIHFGGYASEKRWQIVVCDRQVNRWRAMWPPALTSFLSAGLGTSVCPVALFLWGLCMLVWVYACVYMCIMYVFLVTLHHSREVRWDWVWFLILGRVDSCNISHKCHDIKNTNRAQTHPLFLFSLWLSLFLFCKARHVRKVLNLNTFGINRHLSPGRYLLHLFCDQVVPGLNKNLAIFLSTQR